MCILLDATTMSILRDAQTYREFKQLAVEHYSLTKKQEEAEPDEDEQTQNNNNKQQQQPVRDHLSRFLHLKPNAVTLRNGALFMLRGVLDSVDDKHAVQKEIEYLENAVLQNEVSVQTAIVIAVLFALYNCVDRARALCLVRHVNMINCPPTDHASAANLAFVLLGSCPSRFTLTHFEPTKNEDDRHMLMRHLVRDNMLLTTAVGVAFAAGAPVRDAVMRRIVEMRVNYTCFHEDYFEQLMVKVLAVQLSRPSSVVCSGDIIDTMWQFVDRKLVPSLINTLVNAALNNIHSTTCSALTLVDEIIFESDDDERIQVVPFDIFDPWVPYTDERCEIVKELSQNATQKIALPVYAFQGAHLLKEDVQFDKWFTQLSWVGKDCHFDNVVEEELEIVQAGMEWNGAVALAARLLVDGHYELARRELGLRVLVACLQLHPQVIWMGGLIQDSYDGMDADIVEIIVAYSTKLENGDESAPQQWPVRWSDRTVSLVTGSFYENDLALGSLPKFAVPVYTDRRFLQKVLPRICTTHIPSGWWSLLYKKCADGGLLDLFDETIELMVYRLAVHQLPYFVYSSPQWNVCEEQDHGASSSSSSLPENMRRCEWLVLARRRIDMHLEQHEALRKANLVA